MIFFRRNIIHRDDGQPYLDRLRIIDCPWFGVYLHRFLGPDDQCLHDHPWVFVSIILRHGYFEAVGKAWCQTWDGSGRWLEMPERWHPVGSVLFRRAAHAHRITFDDDRPPVTLVLRGPRVRDWGFWGRMGWIPWQKWDHSAHCA